MSASELLVMYFFQCEPGESVQMPNAFMARLPSNGSATFGDFLAIFPCSKYYKKLHYRFKSQDSSVGYVWLDIASQSDRIPICNGVITVKILKLDSLNCLKRRSRLRRKIPNSESASDDRIRSSSNVFAQNLSYDSRDGGGRTGPSKYRDDEYDDTGDDIEAEEDKDENDHRHRHPPSAHQPHESPAYSPPEVPFAPAAPTRPGQQAPSQAAVTAPKTPNPVPPRPVPAPIKISASTPSPATSQDTFNFFEAPSPTSAADAKSTASTSKSTFNTDDPLLAPPPVDAPAPSRAVLAAIREQEIKKKMKDALEFKRDLEENARKESEEIEVAKARFDKTITAWAMANSKEKKNIRNLLTSMHTVLWADNKWKPLGLGDVIDAKQVKLQYRKAMLVVHPDRCSGQSPETLFIAKRVFEAINEAYQDFLKKEGGV